MEGVAMTDHAATVAAIYEAFGRGDVDAILEHLADDVEWEVGVRDTGLDYLRERHGKEEVAGFFQAVATNLVLTHFEPLAVCVDGDYVMVPVRHAGHIVGGGQVPMTTEAHIWRFGSDGKVAEFRHVFDYAIHERAAGCRAEQLTGRTLHVLGDTVTVDAAGGQLEIFEVSGSRDSGPPPHSHPWDEAYIGVDGEVEVTVGDTSSVLRPGAVIRVPDGMLHCYRIVTDGARFRVITSGHRASLFFADMEANAPAGAPTPESLPAIIDVARRNGLASPLFA
jgi:ketosteroid isomerase-like protein/quercetin dioxygenase-like cupin family protein